MELVINIFNVMHGLLWIAGLFGTVTIAVAALYYTVLFLGRILCYFLPYQ